MLSFNLLGQVALYKEQHPLNQFRSQKEVALLIYLAHTKQTHSREHLADLLWDSGSTKQALSNLRTVLTRLRKQTDDALDITRKTLALSPGNLQAVDSVRLLESLAGFGQIDTADQAAALQNVLDIYRGDFLADFSLPGAPHFEAWVITTREQIRREAVAAYDRLGRYALSTNDINFGIETARHWLKVDSLDERAHTLLIRLLIDARCTEFYRLMATAQLADLLPAEQSRLMVIHKCRLVV